MKSKNSPEEIGSSDFIEFIRLVAAGDTRGVSRRLAKAPGLATMASPIGATRQRATDFFFTEISHYLYAGDTALHMAAAAHSRSIAELLVANGADPRVRNRRGAQPLHYASDGNRRDPQSQASVIEFLTSVGADPNAVDKSGVSPLHRAVRTRSVAAVKALLHSGAEVRKANKSGSTPLHLAVQTTGASGSGSDEARGQQAAIIKLLLARGAKPTDRNSQGQTARQAATSKWVLELLDGTKH